MGHLGRNRTGRHHLRRPAVGGGRRRRRVQLVPAPRGRAAAQVQAHQRIDTDPDARARAASCGRSVSEGSPEWEALSAGFASVAGPGSSVELVNPADHFERGLTEHEGALIRAAARAEPHDRAMSAGLAYTDRGVKADEHYLYELRGVLADGTERVLATDVPVWAGHFVLPDPPSGLVTQAGDRRVLVLWNRNPYAATFVVRPLDDPGRSVPAGEPEPGRLRRHRRPRRSAPDRPSARVPRHRRLGPRRQPDRSTRLPASTSPARTTAPPTGTGSCLATTSTGPARGAHRSPGLRSGPWHRWRPTTWPCHRPPLPTASSSRGGP